MNMQDTEYTRDCNESNFAYKDLRVMSNEFLLKMKARYHPVFNILPS